MDTVFCDYVAAGVSQSAAVVNDYGGGKGWLPETNLSDVKSYMLIACGVFVVLNDPVRLAFVPLHSIQQIWCKLEPK